ncbi:methyltransferase domain-containing protein [Vibrio sp. ZSDE26]|uniref:Methyltransferase domain-containing protein n=1 Tax=Vibrio amylolyticus TaxID=2847292 RepID=A0A9X2BNC7_9VIBR|nr:methyltransferase domain-containing protein [Vibrio amylolyticus]MCK6265793.1 methyltransferase domain-containing protein [Vibrio amylolyticus]
MAYRISELAKKVGLSRTALLYYEKQKLITGQRQSNGYRVYSDKDVQRVLLLQQLQAGGLTLKECKACLEAKVDRTLLQNRLRTLDEEIEKKRQSRQLLAAMLGEGDLKAWHENIDSVAPDAHLDWLMKQGFNEKEALRLKWLSKDMNEHEQYMADFMTVFETLERWGPGSESDTLKAFTHLPKPPRSILEIGCGNGLATTVLANQCDAPITAVDNEESALKRLNSTLASKNLSHRVTPLCASMTELPFDEASFDLIWAEGSAYIMGVEQALKQWRPLLEKDGMLMISDLVWLTDSPSEEVSKFWASEYPDIQTIATRLEQIKTAGYEVVHHFSLNQQSWQDYWLPLKKRIKSLTTSMPDSAAVKDIAKEVEIYQRYLDEFGYQMFVLQRS